MVFLILRKKIIYRRARAAADERFLRARARARRGRDRRDRRTAARGVRVGRRADAAEKVRVRARGTVRAARRDGGRRHRRRVRGVDTARFRGDRGAARGARRGRRGGVRVPVVHDGGRGASTTGAGEPVDARGRARGARVGV